MSTTRSASTAEHRRLRLRLVGTFAVERDGERLDEHSIGNRKARHLLKLLAAARGHLVSMDTILDVLWGDTPPTKAEGNVASLVSRLRGSLGAEVIGGGRSGYRLNTGTDVALDIDEAENLVHEAESRISATQPALALTAARAALELLDSGSVFEEESAAEWTLDIGREAVRLLRRARSAGWRAGLAVGDFRAVLAWAQDAVADDQLDEEAHRAVMALYYRLGEPGEALRAYERLRLVLAEELGADPGPDTAAIYTAVLCGEPLPDDQASQVAAAAPIITVSEPGFVGRQREMRQLLETWSDASRGVTSCLLLTGEAGIGKTRLASELAAHARAAGALVLQARCYEAERSLFLQPIIEIVRAAVAEGPVELVRRAAADRPGPLAALVPEVGDLLDPLDYDPASGEIERRRAFEAVASFLGGLARQRPLLVVVDDLHHAGASSVEVLHFALRWDTTAPLLVVATVRQNEADEVFEHLEPLSSCLAVEPLSVDAVRALANAAGLSERAEAVMSMTRGHTLFVVEALRALSESGEEARGEAELRVPASLRSAVVGRVHRCGRDVDEFLRAAVIVGSSFELASVADLLSVMPEELAGRAEHARRAGILLESGAGYEFANDLIREVLYDTTPLPTRVVRHRRLATLLAHQPEAAAGHAAAAGDWSEAVARWLEAGGAALAAFASREAEQLFANALSACALLGRPALTADAHLGRGRARVARAQYAAAAEDLTAAYQLARAVGAPTVEATALVELGWCAYYARDLVRATEVATRAVAHAAAGPRAKVLVGRLRNTAGDPAGSITVLEPLARGDAADAPTRASALSCLGTALAHCDRYEEAIRALDEAVLACGHTGVLRGMLNARFFGAFARANLGDFGGALAWAEALSDDVERYGAEAYRPRALNLLAWMWRELGDLPRAHDLADEALEHCQLSSGDFEGEPAANTLLGLAESAVLAGDESEAVRRLGELDGLLSDRVGYRWRIELRRLELFVRMDPSRAEELVERARVTASPKYEALGLGHLGRSEHAAEVARGTRSPLLVARVAPEPVARQAFESLVGALPDDLRDGFHKRGLLARQLGMA